MAVRNPTNLERNPDGLDVDDSPLMLGGDRTTHPAPYSNRLQLYPVRESDGTLALYLQDEAGNKTKINFVGGATANALHQGGDSPSADLYAGTLNAHSFGIKLAGTARALFDNTKGRLRVGDAVAPTYGVDVAMASDSAKKLFGLRAQTTDVASNGNTVYLSLAGKDDNSSLIDFLLLEAILSDKTHAAPGTSFNLYTQDPVGLGQLAVIGWNSTTRQMLLNTVVKFAAEQILAAISTPANPAAATGKFYVKDVGAGVMGLYFLTPAGLETRLDVNTSGALSLVEKKVLVADATDVTFTGLAGDTDLKYVLSIQTPLIPDNVLWSLRLNGDTVDANYSFQLLKVLNNTVTGFPNSPTGPAYFAQTAGGASSITVDLQLWAKSGNKRHYICTQPDEAVAMRTWAGHWSNTATEITSLTIHSDTANAIKSGCIITLYKMTNG